MGKLVAEGRQGMIAWLLAQSWFRTAAVVSVAIFAGLLYFFGAMRKAERLGALKERLKSKDAATKVEAKMDAVPRPDKPDVVDKLRGGKF